MRRLFFIFVTVIGVLQIPMQSINAQNMKKEEVPQNLSAFPVGKEMQDSNNTLRENPGWRR